MPGTATSSGSRSWPPMAKAPEPTSDCLGVLPVNVMHATLAFGVTHLTFSGDGGRSRASPV